MSVEPMKTRAQARAERLAAARAARTQEPIASTDPLPETPTAEAPPQSVTTPEPETISYLHEGDGPVKDGALVDAAREINFRLERAKRLDGQADDHRLAAALQLAAAKQMCQEHKINFHRWAEVSVTQSWETVRKLAIVGASPDPKMALEDLRIATANRMKTHRQRQARLFSPAAPPPPPPLDEPLQIAGPEADSQPAAEAEAEPAEEAARPAEPMMVYKGAGEVDVEERKRQVRQLTLQMQAADVRTVLEEMGKVVGVEVVRDANSRNFFVSVDSVLADFHTLNASQKAEFMKRATEAQKAKMGASA